MGDNERGVIEQRVAMHSPLEVDEVKFNKFI